LPFFPAFARLRPKDRCEKPESEPELGKLTAGQLTPADRSIDAQHPSLMRQGLPPQELAFESEGAQKLRQDPEIIENLNSGGMFAHSEPAKV
jgi:hypothetical protein